LANHVNVPVVIVGDTAPTPITAYDNIHVSDLEIDGNNVNQDFECHLGTCGAVPTDVLRNNGISLRNVTNTVVERVVVHNARSGGLVAELGCSRVTIEDFDSHDNTLDGLGGYNTDNSRFVHLNLYSNGAAGLSFDDDFNNNQIEGVIVENTATVGIFMRKATSNTFGALQISNSGQHGIFLAQQGSDATTPATNNVFSDAVIDGSIQYGVYVANASCVNNMLVGSQVLANAMGCYGGVPSLLQTFGVICQP
jgi:hypothetical protein